MLTIHTTGLWPRGAVRVTRVASTRRIVPEIEATIDRAWREGQQLPGRLLFDGGMCRLESWQTTQERLSLDVSPTSYRIFFGTNLSRSMLPRDTPRDVMANPIGVSTALETTDGYLLFGRRNSSVAYHPNRVHPFAGSLEEVDLDDVFGAVEREMHEELALDPSDIDSIDCLGMAEDHAIQQPELIFHARTGLSRRRIERQVKPDEHGGSVAIEATTKGIDRALSDLQEFTPVAVATLLLFGNRRFGQEWFQRAATPLSCNTGLSPGATL